MARQLQLLDQAPDWRLDDETRDVGRQGIAAARAALAAAHRSDTPEAARGRGREAA